MTLDELTLPFLDPRKRVADFPHDPHTVQLVAIPTTSGTGSEVSPAAVLTVGDRKETLVDYCLVPDMAIVDPLLTVVVAARRSPPTPASTRSPTRSRPSCRSSPRRTPTPSACRRRG